MGFQGLTLSLKSSNYRHLGFRGSGRMDRLGSCSLQNAIRLEVDTSITVPVHMSEMLNMVHSMSATSLRIHTRHGVKERTTTRSTVNGLTAVNQLTNDCTSSELLDIAERANHPNLKRCSLSFPIKGSPCIRQSLY